jgi:putative transposase
MIDFAAECLMELAVGKVTGGAQDHTALGEQLERLNKEVNRRAEVVGISPSDASIIRLIGAVLLAAEDDWPMQHRSMGAEAIREMLNPPHSNETLQLPPKAA